MTYKLFFLIFMIIVSPILSIGADPEYYIGLHQGVNKIIWGQSFNSTLFGRSYGLNLSTSLKGRNSSLLFEPVVSVTRERYRSKISQSLALDVVQRNLKLAPMAALAFNRTKLKAGFFVNILLSSGIDIVDKRAAGTFFFSNNTLYENYFSKRVQAGFCFDYALAFGKEKNFVFDIALHQFASSFISEDFLNYESIIKNYSDDLPVPLVFSNKAKPTVLIISLYYKIHIKKDSENSD